MQQLSVHPFVGAILPHAGPDDKVIRIRRRNSRCVLIPKRKSIDPLRGAANKRARKGPRPDVPTISSSDQVLLTPGYHETPIGTGCHTWVGTNIGARVNRELRAHRRPVNIIDAPIDIDARRAGSVGPALLLGDPDNHKAAVVQRRDGGSALIKSGELVNQEFATALRPRWCQHLSINILQTAAAQLVIAGPSDNYIAVGQRRDSGGDLRIASKRVDHDLIPKPRLARGKKPRVYVLKALHPALPGENRPAIETGRAHV